MSRNTNSASLKLSLTRTLTTNQAFTRLVWARCNKFTGTNAAQQTFISSGEILSPSFSYHHLLWNTGDDFSPHETSGVVFLRTSTPVDAVALTNDTEWVCYVLRYTGTHIELLWARDVDTSFSLLGTSVSANWTEEAFAICGQIDLNGGTSLPDNDDCDYAAARGWLASLSDSELLLEKASPVPVRTSGIEFDWDFRVGGTVGNDLSGNANNATVVGTATATTRAPVRPRSWGVRLGTPVWNGNSTGSLLTISSDITVSNGESILIATTDDHRNVGPDVSSPGLNIVHLDTAADTSDNQNIDFWYAENPGAGTYTVTFSVTSGGGFGGNAYLDIMLVPVEGAALTGVLVGHGPGNFQTTPGTGTDAVTSGTAQTPSGYAALVAGLSMNSDATGGTPNAGTGFTSVGTGFSTAGGARLEAKRIASGTAQATFTALSPGQVHVTLMAAFKEYSPAWVVSQTGHDAVTSGGTGTTNTLTFTFNPGERVIVFCTNDVSTGATPSIADDQGNTWSSLVYVVETGNQSLGAFECIAPDPNVATVITITWSAVCDFRGMSGIVLRDGTSTSAATYSTNWQVTPGLGTDDVTSGSFAPPSAPGILVATALCTHNSGGGLPDVGTGYTAVDTSFWDFGAGNHARSESLRFPPGTSSVEALYTATGNRDHLTIAFALRDEDGAGLLLQVSISDGGVSVYF